MSKTGFGFLRLPKQNPVDDNSVDFGAVSALVDRYIALGGCYFDTAYTYLGGNSERAIRESVVKRHPREKLRIADKLPSWLLKRPQDCQRFFNEQLERCGVDAFDVYLLHGLDAENYALCEEFGAFAFLEKLRRSGKVRKTGFSYHDSPELLDRILTAHPELDYVQLQINYLDWESVSIQSRRCYEIAVKHGKCIIVMEPVKGGTLANPPEAAKDLLASLNATASPASWAMRFAQDLPAVEIVLSGMNAMEQIEDNMQEHPPLCAEELHALEKIAGIIRSSTAVACSGCAYCVDGCPQRIPISRLFALYNEYSRSPGELWKMEYLYADLTANRGKASDCLQCGACEGSCPQKLNIIESLSNVAKIFEGEKRT